MLETQTKDTFLWEQDKEQAQGTSRCDFIIFFVSTENYLYLTFTLRKRHANQESLCR